MMFHDGEELSSRLNVVLQVQRTRMNSLLDDHANSVQGLLDHRRQALLHEASDVVVEAIFRRVAVMCESVCEQRPTKAPGDAMEAGGNPFVTCARRAGRLKRY